MLACTLDRGTKEITPLDCVEEIRHDPSRRANIQAEVITSFVIDYVSKRLPRSLWAGNPIAPQPSRFQEGSPDLLDPVDHP